MTTLTLGASGVEHSCWFASWDIPENTAGGDYTVKVEYPTIGCTTAERKFEIR